MLPFLGGEVYGNPSAAHAGDGPPAGPSTTPATRWPRCSAPSRARSCSPPAAPRPTTSPCRRRWTARPAVAAVHGAIEHHAVLNRSSAPAAGWSGWTARGVVDLDALAEALGRRRRGRVGDAGQQRDRHHPAARRRRRRRAGARPAAPSLHTDAVQALAVARRRRARRRRRPDLGRRPTRSAVRRASARSSCAAGTRSAARQIGGGQERDRRSGTQNVAGAVGLAVAARLMAAEREARVARVGAQRDRLVDGLARRGARRGGGRRHRPDPPAARTPAVIVPGASVSHPPDRARPLTQGRRLGPPVLPRRRERGAAVPARRGGRARIGRRRRARAAPRSRRTCWRPWGSPGRWRRVRCGCRSGWPHDRRRRRPRARRRPGGRRAAARRRRRDGPRPRRDVRRGRLVGRRRAAASTRATRSSGVTLKLWGGESDTGCCSVGDVDDARRVADHLGIDHHVFNFGDDFDRHVVDPYVADHAAGRTPNPCVECNRHLKFDRLLRAGRPPSASTPSPPATTPGSSPAPTAGAASARGADRGQGPELRDPHARPGPAAPASLLPGRRPDQGRGAGTRPPRLGLRTAAKPDSQDVCFITTSGGRQTFLGDRIAAHARSRGRHRRRDGGLGRRRRAGHASVSAAASAWPAASRPGSPSSVDVPTATVVVGGPPTTSWSTSRSSRPWTWAAGPVSGPVLVQCRRPRRRPPGPVHLAGPDGAAVTVRWTGRRRRVAAGQSVVLYDGDEVVGGGLAVA